MIVLLRSTDGNPDSRFEKYVYFLEKYNIPYKTFCWDRFGKKTDSKKNIYFKEKAQYGEGVRNILKLVLFNWFLLTQMIKCRKQYNIIHACDFDTIFPAIFMKIIFGKKVIYDIFDWYIDSRGLSNCFVKGCLLLCEYVNIKCSDIVIVCEEERIKQIRYSPKKIWVLPNIPYFDNQTFGPSKNKNLTLSYVGILGESRGLDKLVQYAKNHSSVNLDIAGFGPLEILLADIKNYPNIKYYGTVKYAEGLKIMSKSDLICALYEKSNVNHIFAAPNKYYEGLYLGKPIITTKGTLVGDKTEKYLTGFAIGEAYKDLETLLDNLNIDRIWECSIYAKKVWNEKYMNYIPHFMQNIYLSYIYSFYK